ncbi:hypothetical protein FRC00_011354 [Tulasnella sp. 408]|nr:hypothetical protein FRC00_011354 [Tulasnella sp. 408]
MEYDSDLTDLSEEYAPGPSSSKKTTTARPGYKPRNVLRPPKTSTYSAWSLYEWIQNGGIELEPDDDKKKHWFKPGTGKRNLLPDWLISSFKQKQLVCVEYFDLDEMWEREIFQVSKKSYSYCMMLRGVLTGVVYFSESCKSIWSGHVCFHITQVRSIVQQLGMPLQPAERMAAHVGPWAMFATTIKQDYLGSDSAMWQYWSLDITRARDFQYAAQIIMGLYSLPERCNFATQSLDKWLQRTDPPSESFKKQVRDVFEKLVLVGPYNEKKAIAPVEFVMIAMLINMHPNASTEKLGDLIASFRATLKKDHVDLRANNRVIKSAYETIEALLGSSLQVAYARGSKRKNTMDDDDDDDEYRGQLASFQIRYARQTLHVYFFFQIDFESWLKFKTGTIIVFLGFFPAIILYEQLPAPPPGHD